MIYKHHKNHLSIPRPRRKHWWWSQYMGAQKCFPTLLSCASQHFFYSNKQYWLNRNYMRNNQIENLNIFLFISNICQVYTKCWRPHAQNTWVPIWDGRSRIVVRWSSLKNLDSLCHSFGLLKPSHAKRHKVWDGHWIPQKRYRSWAVLFCTLAKV